MLKSEVIIICLHPIGLKTFYILRGSWTPQQGVRVVHILNGVGQLVQTFGNAAVNINYCTHKGGA